MIGYSDATQRGDGVLNVKCVTTNVVACSGFVLRWRSEVVSEFVLHLCDHACQDDQAASAPSSGPDCNA